MYADIKCDLLHLFTVACQWGNGDLFYQSIFSATVHRCANHNTTIRVIIIFIPVYHVYCLKSGFRVGSAHVVFSCHGLLNHGQRRCSWGEITWLLFFSAYWIRKKIYTSENSLCLAQTLCGRPHSSPCNGSLYRMQSGTLAPMCSGGRDWPMRGPFSMLLSTSNQENHLNFPSDPIWNELSGVAGEWR